MLSGYRPLYSAPGYTHVKKRNEGKVLVWTDDAKHIQEGLILFANDTISSQKDLMEFLNSKGVLSKQGNKVSLEFIARLLGRERLLMYAGYIHYEKRGVSMIQGKHEKLIDLDVVERILSKLSPKPYYVKSSESEIAKKLPLRGFLYDLDSGKKFTGGPSQGRRELFYYYSVRALQPDGKKSLSIDHNTINEEFREYLQRFRVEEDTLVLFDEIMKNIYSQKTAITRNAKSDLSKRIDEIDKDVKKLIGLIRKSRNEDMIEVYENEIVELKEEKKEIELKLCSKDFEIEIDIEELITNTKVILTNPSFIWDLGDSLLQKMLIGVLFNNKIFYNKKSGFQTPEIPLVYSLLSSFDSNKSRLVEMTGLEPVSEKEASYCLPTIVMQ